MDKKLIASRLEMLADDMNVLSERMIEVGESAPGKNIEYQAYKLAGIAEMARNWAEEIKDDSTCQDEPDCSYPGASTPVAAAGALKAFNTSRLSSRTDSFK